VFFGERMAAPEILGAGLILAGVLATELWAPVGSWMRRRRP
jgi:drug/metabolite transporter (DMT)-like permease